MKINLSHVAKATIKHVLEKHQELKKYENLLTGKHANKLET